ncbi:MAG: GAF domain-containing SpoIIE family protein phosphatase [Actinoplanes sp.]
MVGWPTGCAGGGLPLLRDDVAATTPAGVLADPARLRSVARLGLGAQADPAFDRIAALVERLVDVPVALVTVLEVDRQLLPGQVGLPEQVAAGREMEFSHSFSRHVVEAGQPLVVPDVRAEPVMRDNRSIQDYGVVAYAGVPLTDSDGLVLGTLSVMDREPRRWTKSEITLLVDLAEVCSSELRLRIAREIAEEARRHVESAHDQLTLLGDLTDTMAATMDLGEALDGLARIVSGRLADWCLVALAGPAGTVRNVSAAHGSPAFEADATRVAVLSREAPADLVSLIRAARRSGRPIRSEATNGASSTDHSNSDGVNAHPRQAPHQDTTIPSQRDGDTTIPSQRDGVTAHRGQAAAGGDTGAGPEWALRRIAQLAGRMGFSSCLVVPITAPVTQRILGVVLLVNGPGRPAFNAAQERTAVEIGRRAGLAVDNNRLYGRQRHVAEVLQHSMLPALPEIDGFDLHARYLPAQVGAAVGGDWYDAFVQPDGSVMLAVGDVSGHDIEAAATMGQVRNLVRGDAYGRDDPPGVLLGQLDKALHGLQVPAAATAVLARVRSDGDGFEVTFANAGHPPPLLLRADGGVEVWWVQPDPLLGLLPRDDRATHRRWVPAGSTLLLYTDGLVEHPARLIDDGIERVSAAIRGNAGLSAEELCSLLIDKVHRRVDDIAFLVVKLR